MGLTIYRTPAEVPSDLNIIRVNDSFFEYTILNNTPEVELILNRIDKAKRASDVTFIGRDERLGALYKNNLSTGAKILLNILQHPTSENLCFSVQECGFSALMLLIELSPHLDSAVLWKSPCIPYDGPDECAIIYSGVLYTSYKKFFNTLYYANREVEDIED